MAYMAQSPVSFTGILVSNPTATDLFRSSNNGVCGVPLRALGRSQLGAKRRDLTVYAGLKDMAKYDPTMKGGLFRQLSSFQPLKEKRKPVILDFEKPLMDIHKKIVDVQKMADESGLDFTDQITSLENTYQQARKDLYKNLTAYQRLILARHPHRPTALDHIFNITEKFLELHGDRAGYDDPAIVAGLGTINGRTHMFIAHQKGRNSKENMHRNFGMPTPHGYRKALRMMKYADRKGFPIITLVDTPGAYADLESEYKGQGESIAQNLRTMFGLKVPIISIVIGEGGSGGALGIACANKLLMLENAVFYVASPEACAAILWKDPKAAPKAAERLKITAADHVKLQICDGVIPEPLGGAHVDPDWTSEQMKTAILESLDELSEMDTKTLLEHRADKFQKIGRVRQTYPVSMKKKDKPMKNDGIKIRDSLFKQMIEKLPKMIEEVTIEIRNGYKEAARALGMDKAILMVQEEIAKSKNVDDPLALPALEEKFKHIRDEFNLKLPTAPNFRRLKSNLDKMKKLSTALNMHKYGIEIKERLNKFQDIGSAITQKIEALDSEKENSKGSDIVVSGLDLVKEFFQFVRDADSELKGMIERLKVEIKYEYDEAAKALGMGKKILMVQEEIAKAGNVDDPLASPALKEKIEPLKDEFKQKLSTAPNYPTLSYKLDIHKQLIVVRKKMLTQLSTLSRLVETTNENESGVSEACEVSNGSVGNDHTNLDESQVNISVETNSSLI